MAEIRILIGSPIVVFGKDKGGGAGSYIPVIMFRVRGDTSSLFCFPLVFFFQGMFMSDQC